MSIDALILDFGEVLVMDVKDKLELIPTVREARVELTFDPPWTTDRITQLGRTK